MDEEYIDREIDPNSSIVYMALSILCSQQNSLVPEILYFLSPKQIINFIKVFGGEVLRVPTTQEFSRDMLVALVCYHTMVEDRNWDWITLKYDLNGNDVRSIKIKAESWWNKLTQGERDFISGLRCHEQARKAEEEALRNQETC